VRLLSDILATLDAWVRSRPAPKRTLRQIVLERLEEAGPKGSKAAAIRDYAKDNLQCDFSIKAVGMTLNRVRAGQARFGSGFSRDSRRRTSARSRFRGLEPSADECENLVLLTFWDLRHG
jgi:hypothetical protein